MKFIYYTNNIIYGATLFLYLTLTYGLGLQILLGGIQIIFFFVLLFNYDKFSKKIKQHLSIYSTLTTIYLACFFYGFNYNDSILSLWTIILIPMSIGTYFTYIVHQLKQLVL